LTQHHHAALGSILSVHFSECSMTRVLHAKLSIFTGAEGGSGSIKCYLHQPKNIKFFCKEECKAEDILVKTKDVRGQNSRFSTEYEGESSGIGVLTVSITNLTKSDAGRYRSGLGTDLVPDTYCDFDIRVSDGEFLLKDSFNGFDNVGIFLLSKTIKIIHNSNHSSTCQLTAVYVHSQYVEGHINP
uniref:Immunoglobulin V-set domain-containing protein n=1 Tax=Sparus aurata TaxID=8175 RepID=A0A671YSP9_SPAAU